MDLWHDFMVPALRGTENQSVKFAWAEGLLLANTTVPLSPEDLEGLRDTKYGALISAHLQTMDTAQRAQVSIVRARCSLFYCSSNELCTDL
jgi:hypothetical protein